MREKLGLHRRSLTVQLVLSFVALVLLTAVAAGSLALWLIRSQIEERAWAQVDQGRRTTAALYANWRSKVDDLATLTSQRPTLQTLAAQRDEAALNAYLGTLRGDTDLDLLWVCDLDGRIIARTGTAVPADLCALPAAAGLHVLQPEGGPPQVWLLAAHTINAAAGPPGRVLVGVQLDDAFMAQLQSQTGLAHALFAGAEPVASSLSAGQAPQPGAAGATSRFVAAGVPYYAVTLDLRQPGEAAAPPISDTVALAVADIAAAQRTLWGTLAASIALAVLGSSLVGVFLARRIGRPLTQLAGAAAQLSTGDLQHPVMVQSGVWEVTQVAQALEQARTDLQQTLSALRQAKTWTDTLLESIVEGIMTLDEDGRITFFSPGAERLTGRRQTQVLGQSVDVVFPQHGPGERFSQGLPLPGHPVKMTVAAADGRTLTLAITGAQLTPPGSRGRQVALVLRDVTEMEILHRLLGEFLANVTHEFRTPLSALAASAELLRDQADSLAPAERQELFTSLHLGILGLQTLIDNLLESASLEAGRFRITPRPTDLGELVGEAVTMMRPLQEKYGHHLIIDLPAAIPRLQADGRRTVQVLVNLLSNAIKYSPDGSAITLSAEVSDGWAKVTVTDEGPGIPPDSEVYLFRPFQHPTTGPTLAKHGAGLGLSVVKAIVAAHGGAVGATAGAHGGAAFWFTLPLAAPTAAA